MIVSIQYLRGIAALMVVLTHIRIKGQQYQTGSAEGFTIGGDGVDLFFIISGFIMCFTTHSQSLSPARFMINRAVRILPLYWVLTLVALLVFLIAPDKVNASGGTTGIAESFLLLPTGARFLIHNGWTLSYEFYYYAIFALFLCLNARTWLRYRAVLLTLILLSLSGVVIRPESAAGQFLFSELLMEFALGIVAWIIYCGYRPGNRLAGLLLLSGITFLLGKNICGVPEGVTSKVLTSGLPMFFIFLGLISLEEQIKRLRGPLSKALSLLGNSSYSLYLAHPFALSPLAMMLKHMQLLSAPLFTSVLLAGSLITGIATWYLLEKPLSRLTARLK